MIERNMTIPIVAAALAARNILSALVDKGFLSQQEAAKAMTDAADEIRSGTEDHNGAAARIGEVTAQVYEQQAAWLLGYTGLIGRQGLGDV